MYIITQNDVALLNQKEKKIYVKLEMLNNNNKIINSLETELISASANVDAESSSRVNFTCTFLAKDKTWQINYDSKIWIDKRIRPYVGYYSLRERKIIWYKIGTLKFNTAAYQYDTTTKEVSIQCLDLMSTLDGTLGGNIHSDGFGATDIVIEAGTNVRNAIIGLLEDAGITKYDICEINRTVPYDIEHSIESNYYDILKELIELYSGYEMYFDEDGIFVVKQIPRLNNEPVTLSNDIIAPLVISENRNYDFSQVYNYCEVFGESIEPDFYTDTVSGTTSQWNATISEMTSYENGDTIGLKAPCSNTSNLKIMVNSLPAKSVFSDNNLALDDNFFITGDVYCFRYRKDTDSFIYLGQYQAFGVYEETSANNPFSTTRLGYRIPKTVMDENIYSDSLCEQRAKYEIYKGAWLTDTLSLSLIDIPFLTVNQKISYKPNGENVEIEYITKSISRDISSGTMNLELARFSEEYPNMEEVIKNNN